MRKLYHDGKYWEYFDNQDCGITIHWGRIGEVGYKEDVFDKDGLSAKEQVAQQEAQAEAHGYHEIPDEAHHILTIEYSVEGHGTRDDLEKIQALEDRLNETLGWTGLGHCDGFEIGSGAMECFCLVVDAQIGAQVISDDLESTAFSDFNHILEIIENG